jgi:glutamate-1-semialdehyde 2,1-aminomutase
MTKNAGDVLVERAKKVIPGGVNSAARKLDPFIVWEKGEGAYLWDVNGKRYIDYHGAWGPVILGYNNKYLREALVDSMDKYDLYGSGVTEIEIEFAEKICRHIPSAEKVLACTSGSEATYHAIRVSRAYTNRQKIIKFQGCFHGWHDYVLRNALSKPDMIYRRDPGSAGMLDEAIDNTLVCRLNDLDDVEKTCKKHKGQIAAIIIEPLAFNIGCVLLENDFLN